MHSTWRPKILPFFAHCKQFLSESLHSLYIIPNFVNKKMFTHYDAGRTDRQTRRNTRGYHIKTFWSKYFDGGLKKKCGVVARWLTVILQGFFIAKDVGFHVPDKLMGEKLRALSRIEQKLGHITHSVVPQRLNQLRNVIQETLLQTQTQKKT